MGWMKRARTATVQDLTGQLDSSWSGGTAQLATTAGGAVTLSVWNLARTDPATGAVTALTLPAELRPPFLLYGAKSYRGNNVRITTAGAVQVMDPGTVLDHFNVTYVPKGVA
ncbi:MAG: hypothetical protein ACTH6N_04595 [Brachybacterium tyrofermentans]|uniref:hypothetical protein n=1 Tax=Brachybacterium tyrofermentans TaxID=47848 RepID=UPI001868D463|nr:hypothetical protein [Brachybacterium tyrofermentans]